MQVTKEPWTAQVIFYFFIFFVFSCSGYRTLYIVSAIQPAKVSENHESVILNRAQIS